jgi:hypothetical protein
MNRAINKLFSSSSRIIPRIYASSSTTTSGSKATAVTGQHGSGEVHHHDDHGHGHDHHHHHEPELRKTQEWRHHSGIQSKYENQGEDPTIAFMQGTFIHFKFETSEKLITKYNVMTDIFDICQALQYSVPMNHRVCPLTSFSNRSLNNA